MPRFSITVVRADGRRVAIATTSDDLETVCRQALDKARSLAINGCPFGDRLPPRSVRIVDRDGTLVLRIAIDPSLIPTPE